MKRAAWTACCVALLALPRGAPAQPAPHLTPVETPCAVTHLPLSPAIANAVGGDAPVSLVMLPGGAFVAYRDRVGALRLARTDESLEPIGDTREIAGRGGAFSMVLAGDGVALAWVENRRALLLARIDRGNELVVVPRLLTATRAVVDHVALTRAEQDLAVAWSIAGGAGVYAVRTDARALPRGGAQGMGEGELFDLAWLPETEQLALHVARAGARWVISLDARGREVSRAPWSSSSRGPISVDGASWMVQLSARGTPALTRLAASSAPPEPSPSGLAVGALERRDGRAVAVVDDLRAGRATLSRLDAAGVTLPPVSLRARLAGPEAISIDERGEVVAVLRDGRRMFVARARCPR